MNKSWYTFIGNSDPFLTSNYLRITVKHSCLCGEKICAIYADGDSLNPNAPLSYNIQSYIKAALTTGEIQPSSPACSKKYVYLKL